MNTTMRRISAGIGATLLAATMGISAFAHPVDAAKSAPKKPASVVSVTGVAPEKDPAPAPKKDAPKKDNGKKAPAPKADNHGHKDAGHKDAPRK